MDINVKSPFFLTQALLPLLEKSAAPEDPARIIMVGSIDGLGVNRLPTFSYGPSKAAVHHLTRTLASHLAARNITVNAIAPGPFPSKMMAHTLETMGEQIKKGVPLKRIGEPGDMAGSCDLSCVESVKLCDGRRHPRGRRHYRCRRDAVNPAAHCLS